MGIDNNKPKFQENLSKLENWLLSPYKTFIIFSVVNYIVILFYKMFE